MFLAAISEVALHTLRDAFREFVNVRVDHQPVNVASHPEDFASFVKMVNITYVAHGDFPFNTVKPADLARKALGMLEPNHRVEVLVKGKDTVGDAIDILES